MFIDFVVNHFSVFYYDQLKFMEISVPILHTYAVELYEYLAQLH